MQGELDIMLSTAYIPEGGWYADIKAAKWILNLFPSVKKSIYEQSYFDATCDAILKMETQAGDWNKNPENRQISICKESSDIQKALDRGDLALVHSVEGAHSLQDNSAKSYPHEISESYRSKERAVLNNLDRLYDLGVAYLTLAHFYPNDCVYPVFPWPEYASSHGNWSEMLGKWDETKGLTTIGEKVVEKMLDLGMLIDISHCTPLARQQIFDIVDHHKMQECLMASHAGAFSVNRNMYNFTDREIKWMSEHGCVLGIIFMNYWLAPTDTGLGLRYIEETLNHMKNVGSSDCVAIGTDFDGFTDPPDEIVDMSQLPRITKYLKSLQYPEDVIQKFLGLNALRLLQNGWK
jgi:membrane dipeptidase